MRLIWLSSGEDRPAFATKSLCESTADTRFGRGPVMRGDRGFPDGGRVHGAASSSSATSAMRTPTTLPARLASEAIRSTVNASMRLMDAR